MHLRLKGKIEVIRFQFFSKKKTRKRKKTSKCHVHYHSKVLGQYFIVFFLECNTSIFRKDTLN